MDDPWQSNYDCRLFFNCVRSGGETFCSSIGEILSVFDNISGIDFKPQLKDEHRPQRHAMVANIREMFIHEGGGIRRIEQFLGFQMFFAEEPFQIGAQVCLEPERRRHVPVLIHAPAWGATCRVAQRCFPENVSIHAPAWGATAWVRWPCQQVVFQSTHPRGVRRG